MKCGLAYIFVVLLFIGCSGQKTNKNDKSTAFNLIDMTIEGETGVYSLKMSESGKTYICIDENRNKKSIYYTFDIGEKEKDSINYLVRQIKQTKIDTLYTANCDDCISYRIIIKSKDVIVKTKVELKDDSVDSLKYMNKLVSYLSNIAITTKNLLEENFKFNSKTSEFYPIQFTPPPRE